MRKHDTTIEVMHDLRGRLDAVDAARAQVVKAVKAEINGHMTRAPMLPRLTLGMPQLCVRCGKTYLERRDSGRVGYGYCSDSCSSANP